MRESYTVFQNYGIAKVNQYANLSRQITKTCHVFDNTLYGVYIRCIHHEDFMIRTQVYITEQEKKMLAQLSKETGESKSTLIREAIALLCKFKRKKSDDFAASIQATAGSWKDNDFDFVALRKNLRKRRHK